MTMQMKYGEVLALFPPQSTQGGQILENVFANSVNFVGGGDLHNLCIVRHAQWRRKISSKNL